MGPRRLILASGASFLLVIVGLLAFVGSYFLLPLYLTTLNCFDSCTPPKYATAWEFSLNVLSRFSFSPPVSAGILVLLWIPLLAAAAVLGCSFGLLVYPRRAFATGIRLSGLMGGSALVLSLLLYLVFLSGFIRPGLGYPGMLVGYGLFWGGGRLLVTVHP